MIGIAVSVTAGVNPNILSFIPTSLFAAAEPGAWYDFSDLTTLFQDGAGTTPVTAPNQTVGLMLDKSKGLVLGSEILPNGNFSQGSTGWSANTGWSISGGSASHTGASGTLISTPPTAFTTGLPYLVEFDYSGNTGTFAIYLRGTIIGGSIPTTAGHFKGLVIAGSSTGEGLTFQATANLTIDNVSVKLLAGNHATQATLGQRPTYGINPITGTRNLLTKTADFAGWLFFGAASITAGIADPDGGTTAYQLDMPAASTGIKPPSDVANALVAYDASIYVRSDAPGTIRFLDANGGGFDVTLNVTTTWTRFDTTLVKSGSGPTQFAVYRNNLAQLAKVYIWHPQLELGSTATAYQKVVTQYEVTEAGVQSASYISFDGTDDGMVTGTITPGIDKVQVFAGVRKLSDAAVGIVAETSIAANTNNGAFYLGAPALVAANYTFNSSGTINAVVLYTNAAVSAPVTNVLTAIGSISGDTATIRVNGIQAATSAADQGTGNFLAYPLYIGRRGGTSLPFNGRLYSLIVRFGANLTTGQITSTESYVNGKTGAY